MIAKPGRLVFVELKRQKLFKVKKIQIFIRDLLRKAGVEAYIINSKESIVEIIIKKKYIDECI